MKTYAIYNNVSGVGITTTARYFANFLDGQGKKVLLVDLSPQADLTVAFCGEQAKEKDSVIELLTGKRDVTELVKKITDYIYIIGANENLNLETYAVNDNNVFKEPSFILKQKLSQLEGKYDYCVIDCPAELATNNLLCSNALTYATDVVIPVVANSECLDSLDDVYSSIDTINKHNNSALKINTLFLNKDRFTKLHKYYRGEYFDYPKFTINTIDNCTYINDLDFDLKKMEKSFYQYNKLFEHVLSKKSDTTNTSTDNKDDSANDQSVSLEYNCELPVNSIKLDLNKIKENPDYIFDDNYLLYDLKASINQFGLIYPILIDENYTIIDGHRRYAACVDLGKESISVNVINIGDNVDVKTLQYDLNQDQIRAFEQEIKEIDGEKEHFINLKKIKEFIVPKIETSKTTISKRIKKIKDRNKE